MGRFIAVGDVHGCSATLDSLLKRLQLRVDDTVLMLGDLVSKGIDSKGVIQQLITLENAGVKVIRIAGNHELMLLAMQRMLGVDFELPHLPEEMLSNARDSFFVRSNGTWSVLKSYGLPQVDDKRGWLFKFQNAAEAVCSVIQFAERCLSICRKTTSNS